MNDHTHPVSVMCTKLKVSSDFRKLKEYQTLQKEQKYITYANLVLNEKEDELIQIFADKKKATAERKNKPKEDRESIEYAASSTVKFSTKSFFESISVGTSWERLKAFLDKASERYYMLFKLIVFFFTCLFQKIVGMERSLFFINLLHITCYACILRNPCHSLT